MNRPLCRLGTTPVVASAGVLERTGWFRRELVQREFWFADWTIDGESLRELYRWPTGKEISDVTVVHNDRAGAKLGIDSLRALLGEQSSTWGDVTMPDGRVVLLFCPFDYDLDCGGLTAEVVLHEATVEWRDVAWQAAYQPLDLDAQDCPVVSFSFARAQYEKVVHGLLLEESRRSEQAQ